jgi:hypothetical protein
MSDLGLQILFTSLFARIREDRLKQDKNVRVTEGDILLLP